MLFKQWLAEVNQYMHDNYRLNADGAGIPDAQLRAEWSEGNDPVTFVQWFAEKYDLTPVGRWNF